MFFYKIDSDSGKELIVVIIVAVIIVAAVVVVVFITIIIIIVVIVIYLKLLARHSDMMQFRENHAVEVWHGIARQEKRFFIFEVFIQLMGEERTSDEKKRKQKEEGERK